MTSTRWRPDASLRARLAAAGGLGCLAVAGAGLVVGPPLQASAVYPWTAAALFAVMIAAATGFVRGHPFPRLGPANRVTWIRAMLVALTAALIGEPETWRVAAAAVVAATAAAVLDGLDGWLARRSRMASEFGGRVDMETDALLVLVLSVLVWQHDKAGAWVLAGGLMRYGFVAAGWVLPWMAAPLTPTMRGKAVAVAHIVGLIVALAPIIPVALSAGAAAITLAVLTWSFAVDIGRLWRSGGRPIAGNPSVRGR